jgi:hypothetical protein
MIDDPDFNIHFDGTIEANPCIYKLLLHNYLLP